MYKKTKKIGLLGLMLAFSIGAKAQIQEAKDKAANYGVPWVAETILEAIKEESKTLCGVGPQAYICQYVASLSSLQTNNVQSSFSRHLQEQVASGVQGFYNEAFGPLKAEPVSQFHTSMEKFRSVSTKAQSTQSIKARLNMAQWLPIFDALFELGTDKSLAYAVFLIAVFLPEYDGSEPELVSKPKALFAQNKLHVGKIIEQLQTETYPAWMRSDPALSERFESILAAWQGVKIGPRKSIAPTSADATQVAAWTGFLATPISKLISIVPKKKDQPLLWWEHGVNAFIESASQNTAEATTRAYAIDAAASTRRWVQNAGGNRTSTSYSTLQARQNILTQMWSELGLTMHANLWRYLAMIVPGFAQVVREPNIHKQAAMLASILSYVRVYDPEYSTDDPFMQMTFEAIFGGFDFLTPEFKNAFEGNLRWLDPDFIKETGVQAYYASILSPLCLVQTVPETKIPVASTGLSWLVQWGYTFSKEGWIKKWPKFFGENFDRAFKTVILGVGEPAKYEIQRSINDGIRQQSAAEARLSAGAVQLNARLGIDAQRARAIYERLVPTFSHILDAAREAYEAGNTQKTARLMVYLCALIAEIYPEAPTNDVLIAKLIEARLTNWVSLDTLEPELGKLLAEKPPVLACFIKQRLFAAKLVLENCQLNEERESNWDYYTSPNGLAYAVITGIAYTLPGLVACGLPGKLVDRAWTYAPQGMTQHEYVNRAATYAWRGFKSLFVTNVYLGIAKGPLEWIKSQAQLWTQYQYINGLWGPPSLRVDEDNTVGKSRTLFSNRQYKLPMYLSGNAEEGRKDLIVILTNWALNARKENPDYVTFEEFINTPFGQHYSAEADVLRPYFDEMRAAFKG